MFYTHLFDFFDIRFTKSVLSPLRYWDENLNITLSLLSVMDQFDCKTLVFSSSATVYKPKDNLIFNESSGLEPINPYGRTKLTIETVLKDLFEAKLEAFEIDEVQRSENKLLRSKIRKSKNMIELNAWVTAILLENLPKEDE